MGIFFCFNILAFFKVKDILFLFVMSVIMGFLEWCLIYVFFKICFLETLLSMGKFWRDKIKVLGVFKFNVICM